MSTTIEDWGSDDNLKIRMSSWRTYAARSYRRESQKLALSCDKRRQWSVRVTSAHLLVEVQTLQKFRWLSSSHRFAFLALLSQCTTSKKKRKKVPSECYRLLVTLGTSSHANWIVRTCWSRLGAPLLTSLSKSGVRMMSWVKQGEENLQTQTLASDPKIGTHQVRSSYRWAEAR